MSDDVDTLGDALPREMARVRDVVMPAYQSIGPAGAFALCSGFDLQLKVALNDAPDTDTVASWRVKLGALGTASDATIDSVTSALAAGDNQRAYHLTANFESATSVLFGPLRLTLPMGWIGGR